MQQIFISIAGAVLAAIAVRLLRLNTQRVVYVHAKPISWIWKAMKLIGKFAFYYGLIVLVTNWVFVGPGSQNTGIGASIMMTGLIIWLLGALVIYFRQN